MLDSNSIQRYLSVGGEHRFAIIFSVLLHAIVLYAVFGDFNFFKSDDAAEEVILQAVLIPDAKIVETKAEETTAKRDPIPPPPPPPPPPPQKPKVEAAQTVSEPPPPPEKAPEDTPPAPPSLVEVPEASPNNEALSQSVLKTLEELEAQTPEGFDEETARLEFSGIAKKQPLQQQQASKKATLTIDEIQQLRQAIAECWSVPAGTAEAGNLRVEVRLVLASDGRVISAKVIDTGRMRRDVVFRVVAESAERAFYDKRCERLPLPLDKYESWRNMIFTFDAKEMLG